MSVTLNAFLCQIVCMSVRLYSFLSDCGSRSLFALMPFCQTICLSWFLSLWAFLTVCVSGLSLLMCLSAFLSDCLSIWHSVCLSFCLSVCLSGFSACVLFCFSAKLLSVWLSLSLCLSVRLSVRLACLCLCVFLPACLAVCLSVYPPFVVLIFSWYFCQHFSSSRMHFCVFVWCQATCLPN